MRAPVPSLAPAMTSEKNAFCNSTLTKEIWCNSACHGIRLVYLRSVLRITTRTSDRSLNGAIAEALDGTRRILPSAGRAHQLVSDMEVLVVGYL